VPRLVTLGWSRRGLLRSGLAAAASLSSGLGATLALPAAAWAQNNMSPDEALKQMMDGNKRFTGQQMTSFNDDLKLLKEKTAEGQAPFAALLSCADSRVPVELVFDQSIGKLFVCRVAGNIATADLIASLEYGAAVLGTKATPRRSPGRSARFTARSARRSTRPGRTWRPHPKPTPRSRPGFCVRLHRCWRR
jgi:carbonic anhydrase